MAMFYPSEELIIDESCVSRRLRLHELRPRCSRGVGKRSYWRGAPSEPVDKASVAAADNAVLYASVEAFFACRSWVSAIVASVIDPTPLR